MLNEEKYFVHDVNWFLDNEAVSKEKKLIQDKVFIYLYCGVKQQKEDKFSIV